MSGRAKDISISVENWNHFEHFHGLAMAGGGVPPSGEEFKLWL